MFGQHLLFDVGALPYAFLTMQPVWRKHGGALAEHIALKAGEQVLDLGCGAGESIFGMLDHVPGARATGLDLSHTMIALARLRREAHAATFVQGDAMALPFADASFDAVTGHSFLYLVPDAVQVMREVARVLKPGGRCAFLEPAQPSGIRLPAGVVLPSRILVQTLRAPRFVASMLFWQLASRSYGRFSHARFADTFAAAGLTLTACQPTLEGLGLFGTARKNAQ